MAEAVLGNDDPLPVHGEREERRLVRLLDQLAGKVFDAVPFTAIFNATGQPAMSVPLCWNRAGLPIGMHFVGRFGDEATLYRLAGQLERARPWMDRLAPLARDSEKAGH